jgi:hypothetical protein
LKRELLRDGSPVGETEYVDPVQANFIEHRGGEFRELGDRQGQHGRRTLTDALNTFATR